jgi:hypothetical protein
MSLRDEIERDLNQALERTTVLLEAAVDGQRTVDLGDVARLVFELHNAVKQALLKIAEHADPTP